MLWDLKRRPDDHVRGSKKGWAAASFVRPFGQIAYMLWGRQRPTETRAALGWVLLPSDTEATGPLS